MTRAVVQGLSLNQVRSYCCAAFSLVDAYHPSWILLRVADGIASSSAFAPAHGDILARAHEDRAQPEDLNQGHGEDPVVGSSLLEPCDSAHIG